MSDKFKNVQFNGVLKETTHDPRDYKIARFVPNEDMIDKKEFCLDLPENIDITLNQSWYSACVGFAYSLAISVLTYQKTHKWINFDPFMIYGTRPRGEYLGKGMYIRTAGETVHKEGAYLKRDFGIEQEMPKLRDTVNDFKKNNPDLVEYAKTFCIEGYAWVNGVDEIKSALLHGMPVAATYEVLGSMLNPDKNGYVKYPQKGNYRGDHCMLIVGWTSDDHWIVLNSWGSDRNGAGALYIDFREIIGQAMSLSDTIIPIKVKHDQVVLSIGSKSYSYFDGGVEGCKEMDVSPYIKNNRTFVPVRFVAEALGASVEWIAEENTAILRSEEAIIRLNTQSNVMMVNEKEIKMDTKPHILNDRMMVPVRYIAENLNCDVSWNAEKRQAIITAK